jgi:hypothetical protein
MVLENSVCFDTHMEHINTFCGLHVLFLGLNLAVGILTPRFWTVNDRDCSLSVVSLLQAGKPVKSISIPGTDGDHALCHFFTQSLRPTHPIVQRALKSPSPEARLQANRSLSSSQPQGDESF